MSTSSDESPGWDAIDRTLAPLYGDQEPQHYGTIVSYALGGDDPLQGVSAYLSEEGRPHWHYVTYGFSELYGKESDDPDESGWGFEMTFRLARPARRKKAPTWPISFLQNLARYVFRTGNVFDEGHHLNLNGPIALGEQTEIRGALFTADPQLPAVQTPNGRVLFLQVVGLTPDELHAVEEWNPAGVRRVLTRDNPLLITDLRRRSALTDAEAARAVEDGTRAEGSSTEAVFVAEAKWSETVTAKGPRLRLTLGAQGARRLPRMLAARLNHGRDFRLHARGRAVVFRPGKKPGWKVKKDELTLRLPGALVEEMQTTLPAQRGRYSWAGFPGFSVQVVPSEIKDAEGNVVEVIG